MTLYPDRVTTSERNLVADRTLAPDRILATDKFDNQPDFVNFMKQKTLFSRLRFQRLPDANGYTGRFCLTADNGVKHSTYNFVKDFGDDFIKIDDCYVGNLDGDINTNGRGILTPQSNKEIAMYITNGAVSDYFPYHGVGTAFKFKEPIYLLDGVQVDISTLAFSQYVGCQRFELIQNLYARINNQDVAEVRIKHQIDTSGVIEVSGTVIALSGISLSPIYCLMLPMDKTTVTEVLTGLGNSKVTTGDGTNYYFSEEEDKLLSAACLSADNPNYVAVGSISNLSQTMRVGTSGKPNPIGQSMRFWQDAGTPKLYWTSANGLTFPGGSSYSWYSKIAVAEIQNVYGLLKSFV